jgi:cytochrome oxidase assembly protein ShyY1
MDTVGAISWIVFAVVVVSVLAYTLRRKRRARE